MLRPMCWDRWDDAMDDLDDAETSVEEQISQAEKQLATRGQPLPPKPEPQLTPERDATWANDRVSNRHAEVSALRSYLSALHQALGLK